MSDQVIGVTIEAEDKFTEAFNRLNDSLKVIENNLSKTKEAAEKQNSSMSKLATGVGQAAAAFAGFSVMKGMISDFQSAEMAQNKLNKAFENSKGGIGITKKEMQDLGKTLEDKTLFGGEAIASVQTRLISFKNIGGEAFKRATVLALDFASATGQDASQGAMILGKALSNPIEGLGALKKAGYDFNFEQEQMIEKMVRSGNIVGAQNVILKELEGVYKGQSAAQLEGAGSLALMSHKFSQLSEDIGGVLMGYLQPFVNFINDSAIPFIRQFSTEIANVAIAIGTVVVAINGVSLAMSLLTKSNAILLGISLAVFGIIEAFQNWDKIVEWIGISFQKLKLYALEVVRVMSNFIPALMPFKDKFDEMIVDAKKKVDELEREKAEKAETRRQQEINKEKEAADKEVQARLDAETKFQDMLKKLNESNKKEKDLKLSKEREDEFQKKLKEYNNLSKEDIKFLRDEENRQKEQKTKDLRLQRTAYNLLTKEDKNYIDEKANFEVLEQNKKFKKEQQVEKRRMQLTKQFGSEYANSVISEEQRIADKKQEFEIKKKMIEQNIGTARLDATKDFLNVSAQLQMSKTREIFEFAKGAQIAQALMNTWEGVSETIAKYPFPLSVGMGAAQLALGMEQVNNISSQQLENGGAVGGFTGATPGRDTVQIDARPGEMFLNARQQLNLFRKIDSGNLESKNNNSKQTIVNNYNIRLSANGDKNIKSVVQKTIEQTEKRKLQKRQFVQGRFAL